MPYKGYAFTTYRQPVADPAFVDAANRDLAAGKISKDAHALLIADAGRGIKSSELTQRLGYEESNAAQQKAQIAKEKGEDRRNGLVDLWHRINYMIVQSSGAPEGTRGKVSYTDPRLMSDFGAFSEAVSKDQKILAFSQGTPFSRQLEQARKTGKYKALFSSKDVPGFDPSLLTAEETRTFRKARSDYHDEKQRRQNLEAVSALEYTPIWWTGLAAASYEEVSANNAKEAKRATNNIGVGFGRAVASVATIFGPAVAVGAGAVAASVKPTEEIAEAKNAAESKNALLDYAKAGLSTAASAVGAAFGSVAGYVGKAVSAGGAVGIDTEKSTGGK